MWIFIEVGGVEILMDFDLEEVEEIVEEIRVVVEIVCKFFK